jgi:hypothetical protein
VVGRRPNHGSSGERQHQRELIVVAGTFAGAGQHTHNRLDDGEADGGKLALGRGTQLHERRRPVWLLGEYAVGQDGVAMWVQLDQGAESLNKQHRQRLRRNDTQTARLPALVSDHLAHADREHLRLQFAVVGEREPNPPWEAEHPLAIGRDGKNVIAEPQRQVVHSTTGAARQRERA